MQNQFDERQQSIQRRLAQAQVMRDRQFTPDQGRISGGVYIRPDFSQSLAEGLRMYGGMKESQKAEQDLQALQTERTGANQSAMANALRMMGGAPADVLPEDQAGPVRGAQAPDMRGAYAELMKSPDYAQMGQQGMMQIPAMEAQAQARMDDRAFRAQESEMNRAARAAELQTKLEEGRVSQAEKIAAQKELREMQIQAQKEMKALAGAQGSAQPYFQPVQTSQGVMAFNARTGRMEPIMGGNGQPVVGAQFDPALQGSLAGAKTGATTEAKSRTESRLAAPQVVAQADEAVRLVDDLLAAPGFKQAVGGSRMLGIQKIPGTSAKDFDVRLDQLKGKQFLQAFESLKGGGAISEVEGKKATDAIARMDAAGSEAEFTKAAREFQGVIRAGAERAKAAGGAGAPAAPSSAPNINALLDKYK